MDQSELQDKINQIYKVLLDLKKKSSKKKLKWLKQISDRDFGLVEALIDNFMLNIEESEYSTKILMILRQLWEYCTDIIYSQLHESNTLPQALAHYIKMTDINDMTPDAFILITEFFKEGENLEILEDIEFIDRLFDTLLIINKAQYFDSICTILMVRFQMYWSTSDSKEPLNEQTLYFMNKAINHNSGQMFIENTIHLLNRRGSEGERIINCLTHLITYDPTYERIFTNDITLLIDIIADTIDKDMTNKQRESLLYLLLKIIERQNWENRCETIKDICKGQLDDAETLTETAKELIPQIMKIAESVEETEQ